MAGTFEYEVVEKFGVIGENTRGWTRELNLISWNGAEPKYDIRDWSPDHTRMGKGISLTMDELSALKDLITKLEESDSME